MMKNVKVTTTIVETIQTGQTEEQIVEEMTQVYRETAGGDDVTIDVEVEFLDEVDPDQREYDPDDDL